MATPLADVPELEARLGRSLVDEERTTAEAVLNDASAVVRAYGLPWPDPATAPDIAVTVCLAAAERKMRNPEGIRQEMEGGYQYTLASGPSGVELTAAEIRMLQYNIGARGVFSVPVESLGGTL